MNFTRIKVCGITQTQDAEYAESLGADALGFVFVARSKRYISIADAQQLSHLLGPFITRVGLFLNDERELVEQAIEAIPDLQLQFHGGEAPGFCDQFNRPYVKAIGIGSGMPEAKLLAQYRNASAFLFDSNTTGELGGTGHTFDWGKLRDYAGKPLILAGGLNPENVANAIQIVQPYAVDVSTGVEQAPGIKDPDRMLRFVSAVRQYST